MATTPLIAGAAARLRGPMVNLRLFIALWPDAATQERLLAAGAGLAALGRRLPARNLHITVAFLGSVSAARTVEVERAIREARPQACELRLDKLAYFARSRVLSAVPAAVPAELAGFHQRLNARLAAVGFRVEGRAFHPHITLLRDAQRPAEMPVLEPLTLAIREIVLVRCELAPGGSRYEVIRRVSAPG
ncbi:MAG TPA: RNA 2',3'-cyclic phosphodiesterase [Burkholderiales bacterium]